MAGAGQRRDEGRVGILGPARARSGEQVNGAGTRTAPRGADGDIGAGSVAADADRATEIVADDIVAGRQGCDLGPDRAAAREDVGGLVNRRADHGDRAIVGNRNAVAGERADVGGRREFLLFVQVRERETRTKGRYEKKRENGGAAAKAST